MLPPLLWEASAQSATPAPQQAGASTKTMMEVNTVGGTVLDIPVSPGETIKEVKDYISASLQIPWTHQKLVVGDDAVMEDGALVEDYFKDARPPFQVSLVYVSPMHGLLEELVEYGLTKPAQEESSDQIQRKLAILSASAGDVKLPPHLAEWLTLLMEHGLTLTDFDTNDLLEKTIHNSPGLLCFSFFEWCYFEDQRSVGIIDLHTEFGELSFYYLGEDDETYWEGPSNVWKQHARLAAPSYGQHTAKKESYPSLSAFLGEKLDNAKQARQKENEWAELTNGHTCLVLEIHRKDHETQCFRKAEQFTQTFEDCTLGDFKRVVSDRIGVAREKLSVKRRHMFGKYHVAGDDIELLSHVGYKGGRTICVFVDAEG